MEVNYQVLATLHRLLRQKSDLEDRIAKGPRLVRIAENNVAVFDGQIGQLQEKIRETELAAREKQRQLTHRESKIEEYKGRLNVAGSNREYQLISDTIAAEQEANGVLSDEILELMEKSDQLESELAGVNANRDQAVADAKRVRDDVNASASTLQTDIDSVLADLAENEKHLKGDLKNDYTRLVAAHGESALANSDGKTCGNCYHTFTAQRFNELCMKKVVYCKGCGAIMYATGNLSASVEDA